MIVRTAKPKSSRKRHEVRKKRRSSRPSADMVGLCLGCGHKLSVCGLPFTADLECDNCHAVNSYRHSRQPVDFRASTE